MATGNFFATNTRSFYQPPLYPLFLAIIFKTISSNLWGAHLIQFILGALSCVLIYFIGQACFETKVGILAGGLAALYWPFIYFEGELLPPVLLIFLSLNFCLQFIYYLKSKKLVPIFLSGLGLGLAALTQPNILLAGWSVCPLFILLPLVRAYPRRDFSTIKSGLAALVLFIVGSWISMAPVAMYNYSLEKEWVLVSHNGGLNFYIGNSPASERAIDIRPGEEWLNFAQLPEMNQAHPNLSGAAYARFWYQKSFTYFQQEPWAFTKNMVKKGLQFFHAYEFKRNLDLYFFKAKYSTLLKLPLPGIGFILPLGLIGIWLTFRKSTWRRWLTIFVLIYALSVNIFFVTARYRLPMMPIFILFAAAAILQFIEFFRKKQLPLREFILLGLLFGLVNLDFLDFRPTFNQKLVSEAESWFAIGRALGAKAENLPTAGRQETCYRQAIATLQQANALDPKSANPVTYRGRYYLKIAILQMESFKFDRSLTKEKSKILYQALMNFETAEQNFRAAHQLAPTFIEPLYELCVVLHYRNSVEATFTSHRSDLVNQKILDRAAEISRTIKQLKPNSVLYDKAQQLQQHSDQLIASIRKMQAQVSP